MQALNLTRQGNATSTSQNIRHGKRLINFKLQEIANINSTGGEDGIKG